MNLPLLPEERYPQPSGPCPKQQAWWESCDPREKAVIEWFRSAFPLETASDRMARLNEFVLLVIKHPFMPKRTEQHILAFERLPEFQAYCLGYQKAWGVREKFIRESIKGSAPVKK